MNLNINLIAAAISAIAVGALSSCGSAPEPMMTPYSDIIIGPK